MSFTKNFTNPPSKKISIISPSKEIFRLKFTIYQTKITRNHMVTITLVLTSDHWCRLSLVQNSQEKQKEQEGEQIETQ
jgi:hypothetical protein